jgi:hypothetical protein
MITRTPARELEDVPLRSGAPEMFFAAGLQTQQIVLLLALRKIDSKQ